MSGYMLGMLKESKTLWLTVFQGIILDTSTNCVLSNLELWTLSQYQYMKLCGLFRRFEELRQDNCSVHSYIHCYHIVGQRASCRQKSVGQGASSSSSSRISVEYVNTILERLKNKQTRDSTANNYPCVWRQLNKFIINLDYRHNISWEEKTALFGAYLVDRGVQSSTLKSYFSAIKHFLKQDGYCWVDRKALLSSLVKGCKLENDRVKVRLPIQKGLFEMLLFEIGRFYDNHPQPYLELMYRALFCLAYYGMMRVGELTLGDHTLRAGGYPCW